MKKPSLLLAGLALFALTSCNNPYIQTLLKAPSELVSLGVTAYVGDYPLTGGASFEPGFTSSVREYVVYVPKEATGFAVDAQFRGNGTVICMSEDNDSAGGPDSMSFFFAEEEAEKSIVLLVTRENMDTGEYRLTVIRDDGVAAPRGIQVRITPSIGTYFLNRGIIPELEVTAIRPVNREITQSYQWYKNDDDNNRTGKQIPGATSSTYILTDAEAAYEGTMYYYCAITNTLNGRTTLVESGTRGITFIDKDYVLNIKSRSMTDIPSGTVGISHTWTSGGVVYSLPYYPAPWSTPGFLIGTYEVTYQLWKAVFDAAEAGGFSFANSGNQGAEAVRGEAISTTIINPQPVGNSLNPVTMVNWRDCVVWCNAYSEMEGKQPVYVDSEGNVLRDSREPVEYETPNYANNGYRLPTVAEWEYAARGANPGSTAWNYTYIGGNSPDSYHYDASTTREVGGKSPNSIGLYDMGGNVNELVTLPDSEAAAVGHSFDFHASPLGYDCNPIYTDNFIQVTFIGDNKLHAQSSLGTYVTQGFRIMCAKE